MCAKILKNAELYIYCIKLDYLITLILEKTIYKNHLFITIKRSTGANGRKCAEYICL